MTNMKKVGIDARLYSQTGVGVYLRNLIHFIEKLSPKDLIFNIYLLPEDEGKISFKSRNLIKRKVSYHWHSFKEQFFALDLYRDRLDLVHFPYFSFPILYKQKFVSTVHDLTPLHFKTGKASTGNSLFYNFKLSAFKIIIANQIKNSKFVITPTESVKQQILQIFGDSLESKICPVYEGVNWEFLKAAPNSNLQSRFEKEFLLYVGNFYPHKNVENLIRAFTKINRDILLILVGPQDFFSKRISELISQLKQERRIILFHNPKIEDFVFFYKRALALVHPSLSEGFGLPLVEAAYFGCPIVASDIKVFKEVLKDNYLSFDPYNLDDIKQKIEYFLKERPKFNYQEVLKNYSFENMTKETLKIYKRALNM